MNQVSLQDLKRRLSELVQRAAGGEWILISRYRRPVARLGPAGGEGVRTGARFGRGHPRPLLRRATGGLFLGVLEEDRREGEAGR